MKCLKMIHIWDTHVWKQDDVIGITIIIREMAIVKMKLTTGRKQAHVYFLGTGNKLQGKNQIGHAFTT